MTVRILVGDVRDRLRELPDGSVQCVVTSPPYFNLRNYGVDGQLGLEKTLPEYLDVMVDVFRDVRRVLKDDGVLWLNIGDSYAAGGNGPRDAERWPKESRNNGGDRIRHSKRRPGESIKPKDLLMVPARLAIALQDDGWWLRSDIIWAKPNPMPESVTDRPTSAHEHIFLLTKSARYFYDADAVRLPIAESSIARLSQNVDDQEGSHRANGGGKTNGTMKAVYRAGWHGDFKDRANPHRRETDVRGKYMPTHVNPDRNDGGGSELAPPLGANSRNVWTISTGGYAEAHFATFNPEIPRRCIKAGSREGDTVLDPFAGAGTTGLVADELGRDCILIELNPGYAELAGVRIRNAAPLFAEVDVA